MYPLMLVTIFIWQGSDSSIPYEPVGPLLDSVFINTNRPLGRPVPLTTATKEGKTAAKRKRTTPGQKKGSKENQGLKKLVKICTAFGK